MSCSITITSDSGNLIYHAVTDDVNEILLNVDEWKQSNSVGKRLIIDNCMEAESLWPAWFKQEVYDFKQQWNSEVLNP